MDGRAEENKQPRETQGSKTYSRESKHDDDDDGHAAHSGGKKNELMHTATRLRNSSNAGFPVGLC